MKIEFNIPDELVKSFKDTADLISKGIENATQTVKEFDTEAYKQSTKRTMDEIKESLDLDKPIFTSFDEVLKELFGYKEPEEEEGPEEEVTILNQLIAEVSELDEKAGNWITWGINSRFFSMDDVREAHKEETTYGALSELFQWDESPQGTFFWNSIEEKLRDDS